MKKIDGWRKLMYQRLGELENMRNSARTYASFDIVDARISELRGAIQWAEEILGIKK